jgi:serine/threonine protein kinase
MLELLLAVKEFHETGKTHGNMSPTCFCDHINRFSMVSRFCGDAFISILHSDVYCNDFVLQLKAPSQKEEYLYYRPPEMLVQSVADLLECCTGFRPLASIDMWSVGCLFAEMVLGYPLFESAETNFDLLSLHCDLLGYKFVSPNGDLEVKSSTNTDGSSKLREMVPDLCDHGFDLLSGLLACDYKARVTVDDALNHPYFSSCSCELRFVCCCQHADRHSSITESSEGRMVFRDSAVADSTCNLAELPHSKFESYPSFLNGGFSDGQQILPASIVSLVEKRRLKRQREENQVTLLGRRRIDTAPAV